MGQRQRGPGVNHSFYWWDSLKRLEVKTSTVSFAPPEIIGADMDLWERSISMRHGAVYVEFQVAFLDFLQFS